MKYEVLPNDDDIEKAILGAIICDSEIILDLIQEISEDDFYSTQHKKIFSSLLEMQRLDITIDLLTITAFLKGKGGYIPAILANIINTCPLSANWRSHCKILRELKLRRGYILRTLTLLEKAHKLDEDMISLISEIQTLAGSLDLNSKENKPVECIKELLVKTLDKIEEMGNCPDGVWGLPTGIKGYDNLTGGLHEGDLTILAGRPGHGKTSLALTMVLNIIMQNGNVYFQSCEMPKIQLMNKILAMHTGISLADIRQGNISKSDWPIIIKHVSELYDKRLYICDTANVTINSIKSNVLRLMAKKPIHFIVIDYLQLLQGSNNKMIGKEQIVSDISRSLKNLARELNIPVLVLSQLSRAIEHRQSGEPQLSDLRDSGAIEQDADNVFFIRYDRDLHLSRCYYRKQRNGPLGEFDLEFNTTTTKLTDSNNPMNNF